jgi:hypothetical protein
MLVDGMVLFEACRLPAPPRPRFAEERSELEEEKTGKFHWSRPKNVDDKDLTPPFEEEGNR